MSPIIGLVLLCLGLYFGPAEERCSVAFAIGSLGPAGITALMLAEKNADADIHDPALRALWVNERYGSSETENSLRKE
jgi:hypothetical protein